MRLRTDPYRVDLSDLAIIAMFQLEAKHWRFRDVFEDIERAFRDDPFSYNMVRTNAYPEQPFYVVVTPEIPGCPKLRMLIEIQGDIVRVWAISAPGDPEMEAQIIALFDDQPRE